MSGVQNFEEGTRPKVFDSHTLSASSSQAVSAWINRHCNAAVKAEFDKHGRELQGLLDDLSEDDSPKIGTYLVGRAFAVRVAASMARSHAIQLM